MGENSIHWNHDDHDSKPSKDGRPHCDIEEDKGKDDLKGSRPDHVEKGHEVHEALSIHRHEVDYLPYGALLSCLAAQSKSLELERGRGRERERERERDCCQPQLILVNQL